MPKYPLCKVAALPGIITTFGYFFHLWMWLPLFLCYYCFCMCLLLLGDIPLSGVIATLGRDYHRCMLLPFGVITIWGVNINSGCDFNFLVSSPFLLGFTRFAVIVHFFCAIVFCRCDFTFMCDITISVHFGRDYHFWLWFSVFRAVTPHSCVFPRLGCVTKLRYEYHLFNGNTSFDCVYNTFFCCDYHFWLWLPSFSDALAVITNVCCRLYNNLGCD